MSQVIEFKKFKIRKWRRILLIAAAVLLLILIVLLSLRIQTVTMEGNSHYTDQEMEELIFEDGFSSNPLVLMAKERFGTHKEIPFVDKYTISLNGWKEAHVIVYEKDIIGVISIMESYIYFDKDGYVVESTSEQREDIPLFEGLDTTKMVLGEKLPQSNDAVFQEVLNISQYLQSNRVMWGGTETPLVSLTDRVVLDKYNNVTIEMGTLTINLGKRADMEEKLREMKDILPQLKDREGTLYLNTYNAASSDSTYVFKGDTEEEDAEAPQSKSDQNDTDSDEEVDEEDSETDEEDE